MSEPFIGEIRMFAGNYAPENWALCDGQGLPIVEYEALFSLLGTTYGGDGQTTFRLPDMRGRLPLSQGHGPGLTPRMMGQYFGVETVAITSGEMPAHSHSLRASTGEAGSQDPEQRVFADAGANLAYTPTAGNPVRFDADFIGESGGGQPHENRMPAQCLNFIIALTGIYPPRT